MATTSINTVTLTGNLTADPELRALPSGTSVCKLRLAYNDREKNSSSGEWESRANYINVTVWGGRGETAARFLSKGRAVAVSGRLRWHQWETQEGGKRQETEIVADNVVFLGSPDGDNGAAASTDGGAAFGLDGGGEPEPVAAGAAPADDIPF